MKLGMALCGDPRTNASEARLLERAGADALWFPDVPLLGWGDPYVCMGLAAAATDRVTVGSYVMPAKFRAAPLVATQLATLNQLAPGRIAFGYGSGSVTRRLLGQRPLKLKDLREELGVLRDLLDGGRAEYEGAEVRFFEPARPALNREDAIPIHVAASGPRTARLAGEIADGLITAAIHDPAELRSLFDAFLAGQPRRVETLFSSSAPASVRCASCVRERRSTRPGSERSSSRRSRKRSDSF